MTKSKREVPNHIDIQTGDILDVSHTHHVHHAARKLKDGACIIINGGGVYAFASASGAGLYEIAKAKKRNMLERPPVTMVPWTVLETLIDWDILKGDTPQDHIRNFLYGLHHEVPVVTIYPVQYEKTRSFLTDTLGSEWADTIIWKSDKGHHTLAIDTLGYPGVRKLIEVAGQFDIRAIFFTSANLPGDPTIADPNLVRSTFPGITVFEDAIIDVHVASHIAKGLRGWTSYTAIDLSELGNGVISITRLGSVDRELLSQFIHEYFREGTLKLRHQEDARELTHTPPLNDLSAMRSFFTMIREYHKG